MSAIRGEAGKQYRTPKEAPVKKALRIFLIAIVLLLLFVVTASYMGWR